MKGEERREKIIQILSETSTAISGSALSKTLGVSRQVIVQDIAILRANGKEIISTNSGYVLKEQISGVERVFKVIHSDEDSEKELNLFVDHGGYIKDVFVYHKVYGVVKASVDIKSRLDIEKYLTQIKTGKSSLLQNITSGYHYHTIIADSEDTLDLIQQKLADEGFLAKLQDYEPVKFWED